MTTRSEEPATFGPIKRPTKEQGRRHIGQIERRADKNVSVLTSNFTPNKSVMVASEAQPRSSNLKRNNSVIFDSPNLTKLFANGMGTSTKKSQIGVIEPKLDCRMNS